MQNIEPHVVIIGAGFAGLRAAQKLAKGKVRITLIDRNNYHLFQPLLYQVAAAYLDPEQIAKPVRGILRGSKNLSFRMSEVTAVDLTDRAVETDSGPISYDYLIIAIGGKTNYFGLPGLKEYSFPLKSLTDAIAIRSHVLSRFEEAAFEKDPRRRNALLTIVIGGGGPAGVEMAGAFAELVRHVLAKDFREFEKDEFHIVLCEGTNTILPDIPEDLTKSAIKILEQKGVELRLGSFIRSYDGHQAELEGDDPISAETLIWTAGISAAHLELGAGTERGAGNRIIVDRSLQIPGHSGSYVIGDAAYWESYGKPLPMVAPAAVQMADTAVKNILRQMTGQAPKPFTYKNPGAIATIGKNSAVAYILGGKLRGFPAWFVWLVVHIMRLIGFRNRLIVLINWAWDYFFSERASRLILKIDGKR